MLRRTRLLLPTMAAVAALTAGAFPDQRWLVAGGAILLAIAVDLWLAHVEEQRMRHVADQVVAFASVAAQPPVIHVDGGREWQRMVGALNDVATVLRERFEALRAERARVERLLDVMPTAVLLFAEEGLVYANPHAQALFELGDLMNLTPLRALGDKALQHAVDEAAATGRSITVDVRRDVRELMATSTRIGPAEVALVVTDLTDAHRVEAMRRDFVANASHELKTPVTGMQALADSLHLAMERDPDRARTMVERIQQEATRLARLVRDLLDLTRLEEDGDHGRRQPVELATLCASQVERLALLAEQADLDLQLTGEGTATVVGIPDDLKLIVGNLIQNAIQYTPAGGIVRVRVDRTPSHAVIEVSDNGIGIPEADQDRIFERFYRVDKARSRVVGGTGLGLSLVRNAAGRHGGTVQVSSVLGEGSTFTVELPVEGIGG